MKKIFVVLLPPPPVNEPFKGYVGIQFDTSGLEAIEFWDKFMQEYFLETIVTQTNLFTNQKLQSQQENLQPNSHLLKWKPLVFSKLSGFFFCFCYWDGSCRKFKFVRILVNRFNE